ETRSERSVSLIRNKLLPARYAPSWSSNSTSNTAMEQDPIATEPNSEGKTLPSRRSWYAKNPTLMASATVNKSARISIVVRLRSNRLWIAAGASYLRGVMLREDLSNSNCASSMPNQFIPFPFFRGGAYVKIAKLVAQLYMNPFSFLASLL